jgi:hypothetical protein
MMEHFSLRELELNRLAVTVDPTVCEIGDFFSALVV